MGGSVQLSEIDSLGEVSYSKLDAEQLAVYHRLERLSPATQRNYLARFRNYLYNREVGYAKTRQSKRTLRCAINYGFDLNSLTTCPDLRAAWQRERSAWIYCGRPGNHNEGEFNHRFVQEDYYSDDDTDNLAASTRRRSRLKRLPPDWHSTCFDNCKRSSSELQAGLIILYLSGCRPGEVRSAKFDRLGKDELRLTLECSKRRHIQLGVSHRTITLKADTSAQGVLVDRLISLVFNEHGADQIHTVSAKSIQNLCARLSERLWPQVQPGLNPSCFRCLFIADLKADKISRTVIAELAGHTSEDTASLYGVRKQGRSGRRTYLNLPPSAREQENSSNAGRPTRQLPKP
jgi:integrase